MDSGDGGEDGKGVSKELRLEGEGKIGRGRWKDVWKFHSFHSFLRKCQHVNKGEKGLEPVPGLVSGRSRWDGVSELTMKFHTFRRVEKNSGDTKKKDLT